MVRPMLDVRTQAKIEVQHAAGAVQPCFNAPCCGHACSILKFAALQVAPSDYMKLLLRYIDVENIPEYLGGAWALPLFRLSVEKGRGASPSTTATDAWIPSQQPLPVLV